MTAPIDASRRTGRVASSPFSASQAYGTLRALLVAGLEEQTARLAQHQAALAALPVHSSRDPSGLNRARAALHAYRARQAIEQIQAALARMDDGRYGICGSCRQPIPLERLEATPSASLCEPCTRAEGSLS